MIKNVLLHLTVCDYKPQHLALKVDANLMADVCKNDRGLFLQLKVIRASCSFCHILVTLPFSTITILPVICQSQTGQAIWQCALITPNSNVPSSPQIPDPSIHSPLPIQKSQTVAKATHIFCPCRLSPDVTMEIEPPHGILPWWLHPALQSDPRRAFAPLQHTLNTIQNLQNGKLLKLS